MKPVLIVTVPHSGTFFLNHFLTSVLKLEGKMLYCYPNSKYLINNTDMQFVQIHSNLIGWRSDPNYLLENNFSSVIASLRHPHKAFLTHTQGIIDINTSSLNDFANYWDNFIAIIKRFSYPLFITIDTLKNNRLISLNNIAKIFDISFNPSIKQFADDWKPINSSYPLSYELKQHEIKKLQFAVDQYNKWIYIKKPNKLLLRK